MNLNLILKVAGAVGSVLGGVAAIVETLSSRTVTTPMLEEKKDDDEFRYELEEDKED